MRKKFKNYTMKKILKENENDIWMAYCYNLNPQETEAEGLLQV